VPEGNERLVVETMGIRIPVAVEKLKPTSSLPPFRDFLKLLQ